MGTLREIWDVSFGSVLSQVNGNGGSVSAVSVMSLGDCLTFI